MRASLLLCGVLLAVAGCERKQEPAPPPPPPPVAAPAPVDTAAPPPADAGPPGDAVKPATPQCPMGKFYVHGGCYSSDEVGIVPPRR